MTTREASHAGSWYTDDGPTLSKQLQSWLDAVPSSIDGISPIPQPGARIIIAPTSSHAGYSYSGPAAAYAYKSLDLSKWYTHSIPSSTSKLPTLNNTPPSKRIFLLGPSHHLYLPTLALPLPSLKTYSTPLGPIPLDTTTLATLRSTNEFSALPLEADEAEHSLEMHLPYIHHLLSQSQLSPLSKTPKTPLSSSPEDEENDEHFKGLIPILIGNTTPSTERKYGSLLSPYLADPASIFIISSDFCHWGTRFGYTYYLLTSTPSSPKPNLANGITLHPKTHKSPPQNPSIHDSIAMLDHACMAAVESGSHEAFLTVLRETGNTVCGRHPIGVVMAGLEGLVRDEGVGKEGGEGEGLGKEGGVGKEEEDDEKRKGRGKFRFVRYERSSDVKRVGESSVSYASGFAVL
ncbi:MAG: hypothetical protein LQ339_000400 [Xanthoria mediterranea]|nr:MAG: hypothetical protein LQ339_000400 [Xanthoria mediterranea]